MTEEELGYLKGRFDSLQENIGRIVKSEVQESIIQLTISLDKKIQQATSHNHVYSFFGGLVGGAIVWIGSSVSLRGF